MDRPKLSLGSWAFTFGPFSNDPWPFSRVLEFIAEAGYDGVEINGFRPILIQTTMIRPRNVRSW